MVEIVPHFHHWMRYTCNVHEAVLCLLTIICNYFHVQVGWEVHVCIWTLLQIGCYFPKYL